jgi:hypothetical protein
MADRQASGHSVAEFMLSGNHESEPVLMKPLASSECYTATIKTTSIQSSISTSHNEHIGDTLLFFHLSSLII